MTTIFKYSHDYTDDTEIKYFRDNEGSHLECSFTSEDPDYGTETIYLNSDPAETLREMARDQMEEITAYLDATADGTRRVDDAPNAIVYDSYGNSTLYAVESALSNLLKEVE